MQDTINKLA